MQHAITKLHRLGPRPIAEFLTEIMAPWPAEHRAACLERLDRYANMDAAMLRAIGGDTFPPAPLHQVTR